MSQAIRKSKKTASFKIKIYSASRNTKKVIIIGNAFPLYREIKTHTNPKMLFNIFDPNMIFSPIHPMLKGQKPQRNIKKIWKQVPNIGLNLNHQTRKLVVKIRTHLKINQVTHFSQAFHAHLGLIMKFPMVKTKLKIWNQLQAEN